MKRNTFGFTLVELIVTIAVISILASIVIVSYNGWRKSTITTQVKSDLNGAASAMESARTFNNAYLTSISDSTAFKPSQGVTLTGGSSDGGITYCIDASNSQDSTIHYYIDSISGGAGAQLGTCSSRPVPVLDAIATSISTINLSWSSVPGATSYTLQIASSDSFADAATIATQPGLAYTSTGLLASTTYYYRVGVTTSPGLWSIPQSATTTITTPIAPTVVANTAGATTTWQWSAADCPAGTTGRYQYDYTISPAGYDSGWAATAGTSVAFTTSTGGQTYTVNVQAQCYNAVTSSSWSGVGSAAYFSNTGALVALATPTIATGVNPYNITISADGTSVYAANNTSGTISMYSRNTSTGVLIALATPTIATGTAPWGIIISADGTSVYITNTISNNISMYSRNTGTGALTALATPTIATGAGPLGITISADGTSVYAINGNSNTISMYSRNTSTGALTALATPTIATGSSPHSITISADGTSVYVANTISNNISMYSRNTGTGALTALATPTIATGVSPYNGITISADGTSVYVTNSGSNTISMYSRNTSTGALTALATPTIATGSSPYGITISADGTSVYVANYSSWVISMYSRNTSTGALTALATPTIAAGSYPNGITISADGTSVYTANTSNYISMYARN